MPFNVWSRRSPTSLALGVSALAARSSIAAILARRFGEVRNRATVSAQRLRAVTPERWFGSVFVILLLAFLFVLIVQPNAVGRGGR